MVAHPADPLVVFLLKRLMTHCPKPIFGQGVKSLLVSQYGTLYSLEKVSQRCLFHYPRKQNAFAGRAPPEKAFDCLVRRRLCQRWARGYRYPGSMATLVPPGRSLNMPVNIPATA